MRPQYKNTNTEFLNIGLDIEFWIDLHSFTNMGFIKSREEGGAKAFS